MPDDNLTRDPWGLDWGWERDSECTEEPEATVFKNGICTRDTKMFSFGSHRVLARKLDSKLTSSLYLFLLALAETAQGTSAEGHRISSRPIGDIPTN